jgi:undecaprenyl diphosphate synthase
MPDGIGGGARNTPYANLHVAIIMDGSGRWAEARGLPRSRGHQAGRKAVGRAIEVALDEGVRVLTLFTFSTENWGRPEDEVSQLMEIFEDFLRADAPAFASRGVRITVIGRRDRLPDSLRRSIDAIELSSREGGRLQVRLAIDYSGREAIADAARRFGQAPDFSTEAFGRALVESAHTDGNSLDIDLLVRTGGELRLSNCPLWEIAYAELYFTPCLWPDFARADFQAALSEYSMRQRRFGRIAVASHRELHLHIDPQEEF